MLNTRNMTTTKVFKSGNSQAVRLPAEFAVSSSELHIQKVGKAIVLTEIDGTMAVLEAIIDRFSDDIFDIGRDQPRLPESVIHLNDDNVDYKA
jgi:antitoxin VapB